MSVEVDGIYAAYLTSKIGQGLALLMFHEGVVTGADAGGVTYDGSYEPDTSGYRVTLVVNQPPNIQLLNGQNSGPQGGKQNYNFNVPTDFHQRDFVRLDLPYGALNAKFVRLRGL